MNTRLRNALAAGLLLAGFGAYVIGGLHSPLLSATERQQRDYAARIIREEPRDDAAERALAEAYWQRYPDVAADPTFGRRGRLGINGAREHFQRHGRHEGRIWGL